MHCLHYIFGHDGHACSVNISRYFPLVESTERVDSATREGDGTRDETEAPAAET